MSESTVTNPPPLKLYAALHAASGAIEAVAKSKTATVASAKGSYQYKFASTEDMMQAAREALLGAGVIVQRIGYTVEQGQPPVVLSTFRVVHAASGESEVYGPTPMPISSHNAADKALAGALTYGWSYFLRDLLAIPREDEHDPDRRKDEDRPRRFGAREQPPVSDRRPVDDGGARRRGKPKADAAGEPPPPTATASKYPDGSPEHEAHRAMVRTAKTYLGSCERHRVKPALYEIAGSVLGDGVRWDANKLYTVEQITAATKAIAAATFEQEQADPPSEPVFCAACGKQAPEHADGCPEAA